MGPSFVNWLLKYHAGSIIFGPPNSQADGCDEQQLKYEFHHRILYRPTNKESASLRTSVVLVRVMANQVQDAAEAY
jgi:hypothetical protein